MSTLGVLGTLRGCHEYILGSDTMSISRCSVHGGYWKHIAGCPVHWRDIMIHVGRYHDSCVAIP